MRWFSNFVVGWSEAAEPALSAENTGVAYAKAHGVVATVGRSALIAAIGHESEVRIAFGGLRRMTAC
ncbi:MAG: hypothetical protein ACREFV_11430 [Acetobacteraceae bacterium]